MRLSPETDAGDSANSPPHLNLSEDVLVATQNNLAALRDFLVRNPHLFQALPSEPASSRASVAEQSAWKVCFLCWAAPELCVYVPAGGTRVDFFPSSSLDADNRGSDLYSPSQ